MKTKRSSGERKRTENHAKTKNEKVDKINTKRKVFFCMRYKARGLTQAMRLARKKSLTF